jgi:UDP-N-acetylmuramate--alanine ligase
MNSPFWGALQIPGTERIVMMSDQQMIDEFRVPLAAGGTVYFIGIGGIGMSALARFFRSHGFRVSGYDKTPTELTAELEESGIEVHFNEDIEKIPKDPELVVYTPAIPADHKELVYCRENGFKVVKRSDVLEVITASSFNICIAGTHGKTTTTTMVAHLLTNSGYGCNAFLGGISVNYGTNYLESKKNVCVVEADEYDRSFLKLSPDIAVISAMDADHLDIYGTAAAVEQGFIDFSRKIRKGGLLIGKYGLRRTADLAGTRKLSYSVSDPSADVHADNLKMINGGYEFDVSMPGAKIRSVRLNMGGMHNVENAMAAITVASSLGIDENQIRKAVESFRGVRRRFEYIIRNEQRVMIDDYAHHPEELRALITSAKNLFAGTKCRVIFQPHLYSRTNDLAEDFARALDLADEVILLPIYPAREKPIPGVSSEMIAGRMKNAKTQVMTKTELMDYIKREGLKPGELLITAGAGDIDTLVQPIGRILEK